MPRHRQTSPPKKICPPPPPKTKKSARRLWWALTAAGVICTGGVLIFFQSGSPQASLPNPPPAEPLHDSKPPEDPSAPFLRAAEECSGRDDLIGMLENFTKALEVSPERDDPRRQMEMITAKIRSNAMTLTREKFLLLRKPLEQAARHNVVSAQILLGEWLRPTEPHAALKWFAAAAANGQTEAMTQAGLMMTNGLGQDAPDFPAAVAWFEQGAAAGDSDAMVALADCYLLGKGVARNEKKALEILQGAAVLNHPQGMNKLGDLLKKGLPGLFPPNYEEAIRLFSSAKKLGNGDAQANLGVMYVNGLGLPKDLKKAFALWKEGAEKLESPMCMYFYAVALEGGLLGTRQPDVARGWYYRAAILGNRTAAEWCKKNGIPLLDKR